MEGKLKPQNQAPNVVVTPTPARTSHLVAKPTSHNRNGDSSNQWNIVGNKIITPSKI